LTSNRTLLPLIVSGEARESASRDYFDTYNPATGEVLARVQQADAADVDAAVSGALRAFESWRRVPPMERAQRLNHFANLLEAAGPDLILQDVLENGSPIREMRNDLIGAVTVLRYFAGLVMMTRGETVPGAWDRINYSIRQPFGVVARIIPFNHPLLFAVTRIAGPVVTGNTVVIKPSEYTNISAVRVGEIAQQAFPPGVVSVLTGSGAVTGDALVSHPDVRRIGFTGSLQTGLAILRRASERHIKHLTLELGGKNPLVVFNDADIEVAIKAAQAGMNFTWQGQSCGSTSRLLVQADIYAEFVTRLAANVDQLKSGSPTDESTEIGAIVSRAQFSKVQSYIEIGTQESRLVSGGETLTDGPFADGLFVRPAVFADVPPESRLAQEEIFGPVLACMPFQTYDDAIAIANNVEYGLTASVFTQNLRTANKFARDIEAGYVWVNDVGRHTLGASFGGLKNSGIGREEDVEELLSYTVSKNVHVNFTEPDDARPGAR
jgi:betaine-aldehyde dehydrogenase